MYLVMVDIKGEGHKEPNQICSMQSELLNVPHCPKGGGNLFCFLVRFVNMRPILKEMMKSGTCMKGSVSYHLNMGRRTNSFTEPSKGISYPLVAFGDVSQN